MTAASDRAREASLRRLHALVRNVNDGLDLERTLRAVCQGVVDGLDFGVAVVNLVMPDGALEVVAVAGEQSAHEALFGSRATRREWDELLGACTPVGNVLVDYDHDGQTGSVPTWIPDTPVQEGPDAWQPLDGLFAPLRTAASGLLGVISVDVPRDGRRPGLEQLELLEMYSAQASTAIENATLHTAQSALLAKLSVLVQEAPVAIVELDRDGLVREWNPEAERVFGWSRADVVGRRNPTVDGSDYEVRVSRLVEAGGVHRQQVLRRCRDGRLVDVEMSSKVLRDAHGQVDGYIGALVDVSERVALEGELRAAAYTDPLTGLGNRARFRERLAAVADEPEDSWLLLLDLDGFKSVNDTLGHGVGDELLVQVSDRLQQTCRRDDLVARLGGDEFVLLVRGDEHGATRLADRVVHQLSQPFSLGDRTLTLGCSLGLAPTRGSSQDSALRDADLAMYAAKAAGKGRAVVFSPPLAEAALQRADLAADLRLAVSLGQLELRWHPLVDVRTRGVVGMEALVRWDHPRRGLLAPGEFIGLAEQTGAVVEVGEWVLHAACHQARQWQRTVPPCAGLDVTVNLSPVQLRHPSIVATVDAALRSSGLEPDRLVLELTEDVLLEDLDAAVEVLTRLRALGVRLAIDDFGAGYSSLRYLKRLPVDVVKLDRGLLDDVHADPDARALVDAVLGLVRTLGRVAVAEGVETAAQLQVLEELGCPLVQGFLLSRPLTATDAERILRVGPLSWPVPAVPAPRVPLVPVGR